MLDDWAWFESRRIKSPFATQPSREELLRLQQDKSKEARGDIVGPDVSDETLRSFHDTRA